MQKHTVSFSGTRFAARPHAFARIASPWLLPLLIGVTLLVQGLAAPASAATPADLYESQVLVAGRDSAALADGRLRAFRAVLVKLTGRRDVDAQRVVPGGDVQLAGLVEQFQLRGADASEKDPLRLWVRFHAAGSDSALRAAGQSVWPRQRPLTVLLLGLETASGERRILAADARDGLAAALTEAGSRRGLPVVLPLMDLADQRNIGPPDVWGGFTDRLTAAAARYRGDALVHGVLSAAGDGLWAGSWELSLAGEHQRWQQTAAATTAFADAVIDSVTDAIVETMAVRQTSAAPTPRPVATLAAGPAAAATGRPRVAPAAAAASGVTSAAARAARARARPSGGLELVVSAISDARDYGVTYRYLDDLDVVERVEVLGATGDRVTFVLIPSGAAGAIRRAIDIGGTLSLARDGALPEYRLARR